MQFVARGTVKTGQDALDYAISDLELMRNGDTVTVVASSGPNGGLVSYRLPGSGTASVLDSTYFNPNWAAGISDDIALYQSGGGYRAVIGATGENRLGSYSVGHDGLIGGAVHLYGMSTAFGRPDAMHMSASGCLLISGTESGFAACDIVGTSLQDPVEIADTDVAFADAVGAITRLTVAGSEIAVVGSTSENGITSYRMTGNGPVLADRSGPDEGLGIMRPTDFATAEVRGTDYVIVASAQNANGALSVLQVGSDGAFTSVDHIIDTRDTRFGGVQAVETVSVDGITYVIAGGGDDGLSLFVLLPGGKLQLVATIEDSTTIGLTNVSDIAATVIGDQIRMLVASSTEAGLTDLSVDIGNRGIQHLANAGGQTFGGTAGDDILIGQAGVDRIDGGAGSDILYDGHGRDLLTGGSGFDIFVLCDDGTEDIIVDFDPARDRLDLSSWPMFYDPSYLDITPTNAGAEIVWKGATLVVRSASGGALDPAALRAAVLQGVNRPLDLSNMYFPDDGLHDITGTPNDDVLRGGPGAQTIAPGPGNDIVWAGDGDDIILGGVDTDNVFLQGGNDIFRDNGTSQATDGDQIFGGAGDDQVFSGTGDDHVDGGDGDDRIYAGDGRDTIEGGAGHDLAFLGSGDDVYTETITTLESGHDTVRGAQGDDWIATGGGNDLVYGGPGIDTVFGGNGDDQVFAGGGNDILYGDAGADTLNGLHGQDEIYGGAGDDILRGGDGGDFVYGEAGTDQLFGGYHHDRLFGGAGDDEMFGEHGDDILYGEDGADRLIGANGNDRLRGEDGQDWIQAGNGNDQLYGGSGNDTLYGDDGNDVLYGAGDHDKLHGGRGIDVLNGGNGNDVLRGDQDADDLRGDAGADRLYGGAGNDYAGGGDDDDEIYGGSGNDRLHGGAHHDYVDGEDGDDRISGGWGHDKVLGGNGNDHVDGGGDNDKVYGGAGNDRLYGSDGNDFLDGGHGNDRLKGGAGADTFLFLRNGNGNDTVTDFDPARDSFRLQNVRPHEVTLGAVADGLEVAWNTATVLLRGLEIGDFTVHDIDYM